MTATTSNPSCPNPKLCFINGCVGNCDMNKRAGPMQVLCPACTSNYLHNTVARNALSKYAQGIYICSTCGRDESWCGNFWNAPKALNEVRHVQDRWIAANKDETGVL